VIEITLNTYSTESIKKQRIIHKKNTTFFSFA
jgi:hypothetical protein